MISVVIIAQRVLLREGIASLLQNTRFKVVTALPGPDQFARIPHSRPREILAVIGVDQQDGNLDQASESIRLARSLPVGKVALLFEMAINLQPVLALSPDACLININSRDVLLKALELTLVSERLILFGKSPAIRMKQDNEISDHGLVPSLSQMGPSLSQRETQILQLLARGTSNKEMARLTDAAEATIKGRLKAILRKTNSQNRTQAAIWAIEHGFRETFLNRQASVVPDTPTLLPAATRTTDHHSPNGKRAA